MYEYLCQHPLVLRAKRRETHYLDWRWRDGVTDLGEQVATCELRGLIGGGSFCGG